MRGRRHSGSTDMSQAAGESDVGQSRGILGAPRCEVHLWDMKGGADHAALGQVGYRRGPRNRERCGGLEFLLSVRAATSA